MEANNLRRRAIAFVAACLLAGGGVEACFFSLDDVVSSDAGAGTDGQAGGGDGSTDFDAQPGDGGGFDAFGCVPSGAEDCTNGKDDDCNGKADCDDPACGAFQCVATPPAGWTPLFVAGDAGGATCPAPSTNGQSVAVLPANASQACTCNCAPQGPTCASGSLAFYAGNGGTCPTTASATGPVSTSCTDFAAALNATSSLRIDQPAGPTGCTATLSPPPAPLQGSSCGLTGEPAGRCASTLNECVHKASAPFTRCIAGGPDAGTCPAGYPNRFVMGSSVADTRTCAGCSCGVAPCVTKVEVFARSGCTLTADYTQSPPDGTCQPVGGNVNARSYKSQFGTGCEVTDAATTTGTLSFAGPQTVCCM